MTSVCTRFSWCSFPCRISLWISFATPSSEAVIPISNLRRSLILLRHCHVNDQTSCSPFSDAACPTFNALWCRVRDKRSRRPKVCLMVPWSRIGGREAADVHLCSTHCSDLMMMARPSRTPRAPQSPSNNGLVALLRRNLSASGKRGSGGCIHVLLNAALSGLLCLIVPESCYGAYFAGAGSRPVSGSAPSRTLPPSTTSPPGQVPTARSPSPRSSPGVSESYVFSLRCFLSW